MSLASPQFGTGTTLGCGTLGRPTTWWDLWTTSLDLDLENGGTLGRPGPWDDLGTTWTFGRPRGTLGRPRDLDFGTGGTLGRPGAWDDVVGPWDDLVGRPGPWDDLVGPLDNLVGPGP